MRKLAGIEYAGRADISEVCLAAVFQVLLAGPEIEHVRVLSFQGSHGLMLRFSSGSKLGIKTGFTSGYSGEGPRTFAFALRLLREHSVVFDECNVGKAVLQRLNESALTVDDLTQIDAAPHASQSQMWRYLDPYDREPRPKGTLWRDFRLVMPFGIIDERLFDLALTFFEDPNDALMRGFRRLETVIGVRIGSQAVGTKLFATAFQGSDAKLVWMGLDAGEAVGRAQLFTAAYMAFRNPRAHREAETDTGVDLGEFLVLNQLYRFERTAIKPPAAHEP